MRNVTEQSEKTGSCIITDCCRFNIYKLMGLSGHIHHLVHDWIRARKSNGS